MHTILRHSGKNNRSIFTNRRSDVKQRSRLWHNDNGQLQGLITRRVIGHEGIRRGALIVE